MRLRVGVVFCLFLAFWGAGCRNKKTLAPSLDNQAPQTWIVAAPQDTITTRDPSNVPVRPGIGRIPVRFHMYWAGSDRDGVVVGYYFAVVETLPVPQPGASRVPPLPGPRPRDYRFTAKTDSLFIFNASEQLNERQHAFYIYAVDDKGRPDATPARFIFSSYDRFPPLAIIDELTATGTIYQFKDGVLARKDTTYAVRDSFELSETHSAPRDTIPANSVMSMRWHGEPTTPSTIVTGYRYKLDEPTFNTASPSVTQASYNTGVGLDKVGTGQKIFTLRAIGQSGWRGESTRWFQMNFAPDSWFAGPDPNDPNAGWVTHADGRYIDLFATGWEAFKAGPGVPGTQLSADSAGGTKKILPADRPERKSFFEIYNDRLYVRQEGDTVNLNSWVVFPAGGFDRDSPYRVKVNEKLLPTPLIGLPVLIPTGPNGSPIGFRIRVQIKEGTSPTNRANQPSETTTYPVYDPASVFHQPVINGYWGLTTAGKAYAVVRAEDGDGEVDRRIDRVQLGGDAVGVADRVDPGGVGGASAEDRALRSKILTFYVDKAPTLRRSDPLFRPRAGESYPSRTITLTLPADDVDQLDPNAGFNKLGGTPAYAPILRRKVAILGKWTGNPNTDTCYVDPGEFNQGNNIVINIPGYIAKGPIVVRIRLCDCAQCDDLRWPQKHTPRLRPVDYNCPFIAPEASPGQGRCVDTEIKATLTAADPEAIIGSTDVTPRPGFSAVPGRRQQ